MHRLHSFSFLIASLMATVAIADDLDTGGRGVGVNIDIPWQRIQIDEQFRAEGVAVGDFNHDGLNDIAAGDVWYQAPDWTRREIRQPLNQAGKPTEKYDGSKGYSNSFALWAYDVNQDGWDDIIIVGYPGAPFYWYENPHKNDGHWPQHEIWHSACNETPLFTDVTGDGKPDIVLGSQPERQMGYLELPTKENCTNRWKFTPISEPGDPNENGTFMYYHGLGVGDMNQDGRMDVIIPHGWWESPAEKSASPWTFHPQPLIKEGEDKPAKASNIYILDLDLDGDMDVVMSSAHAFGVWWWENQGPEKPFAYHLIDESFSQTHALWLVDMHDDSTPTLVTGKRYFAHMGSDPGEFEDVVMNTFEIRRSPGQLPTFVKTEIVEGRDTGVGTQFHMTDFDKNGTWDIVLSNKKGVNVLLQSNR